MLDDLGVSVVEVATLGRIIAEMVKLASRFPGSQLICTDPARLGETPASAAEDQLPVPLSNRKETRQGVVDDALATLPPRGVAEDRSELAETVLSDLLWKLDPEEIGDGGEDIGEAQQVISGGPHELSASHQ